MIRAVDNEAATLWTQTIGDDNLNPANSAYTVGFSVIQVSLSDKHRNELVSGRIQKILLFKNI